MSLSWRMMINRVNEIEDLDKLIPVKQKRAFKNTFSTNDREMPDAKRLNNEAKKIVTALNSLWKYTKKNGCNLIVPVRSNSILFVATTKFSVLLPADNDSFS